MPSLDPISRSLSRRALLGFAVGAYAVAHLDSLSPVAAQTSLYTFLVLGIDTREDNADQRSDVIMVSRVNVNDGSIRTLSIPRDLWVEIPGSGQAKINAAYQQGLAESNVDWEAAASLTQQTIELNFGLTLDAFAVTDMNRFPAVIDAVGGVDVENPYDLGEPDATTNLIFPAGPLHLDGEQALLYCRLRHQDGDGARVMRQQMVLEALLVKVQSPTILTKLPALIGSLNQAVRHNIPAEVQSDLVTMLPNLSSQSLDFTNIDTQLSPGTSAGGAWIYEADWETLPGYVQGWLDGTID